MQTGLIRISRKLSRLIDGIALSSPGATRAAILDELALAEAERRYAALPAHVRKTVESRARKAAEKKQPA